MSEHPPYSILAIDVLKRKCKKPIHYNAVVSSFKHEFLSKYKFPSTWKRSLFLALRKLEKEGIVIASGYGALFFHIRQKPRGTGHLSKKRIPGTVGPISPPTSILDSHEGPDGQQIPRALDEDLWQKWNLTKDLQSEDAKRVAVDLRAKVLDAYQQRYQQEAVIKTQTQIQAKQEALVQLQEALNDEQYRCYTANAGKRDLEKTIAAQQAELRMRKLEEVKLHDEHRSLLSQRQKLQSTLAELDLNLQELHAEYEKKLSEASEQGKRLESEKESLRRALDAEYGRLESTRKQKVIEAMRSQQEEKERLLQEINATILGISNEQRALVALKVTEDAVDECLKKLKNIS